MEYVLAGLAWIGASVLAAAGWSRFFRGMDTLPDHADAAPTSVRADVDWDAEYRRALEAEVPEERRASDRSA